MYTDGRLAENQLQVFGDSALKPITVFAARQIHSKTRVLEWVQAQSGGLETM